MKLDNPLDKHFKKDMEAMMGTGAPDGSIIKSLEGKKTPAEIFAVIDEHYTLDREK